MPTIRINSHTVHDMKYLITGINQVLSITHNLLGHVFIVDSSIAKLERDICTFFIKYLKFVLNKLGLSPSTDLFPGTMCKPICWKMVTLTMLAKVNQTPQYNFYATVQIHTLKYIIFLNKVVMCITFHNFHHLTWTKLIQHCGYSLWLIHTFEKFAHTNKCRN